MAVKQGMIVSVPKELGSDEYITRSRSPKELLSSNVMADLRRMVKSGATVPDLVHHVQKHHGLAENDAFLPTAYLWQTFSIGLNDAKAIGLGHQYLAGTFSDEEINQMVMPCILAHQEKWDVADDKVSE